MVEVSCDSFTRLLGSRPLLRERVMRRSRLRYQASWRAIGANSVFATFSMAQARCWSTRSSLLQTPPAGSGLPSPSRRPLPTFPMRR